MRELSTMEIMVRDIHSVSMHLIIFSFRKGLVRLLTLNHLKRTHLLYFSANDIFDVELTAAGTIFQAPAASRSAFITLLQGDQWMIFKNVVTNVLHWDFVSTCSIFSLSSYQHIFQSVLGRIISLPVADNQCVRHLHMRVNSCLQ